MSEHLLSRRGTGRLYAVLYAICGLATIASAVMPRPPGFYAPGVILVGGIAVLTGFVLWLLPWHRWPRRSLLCPAFASLPLIAIHNYWGGADPYRYGLFFLIAFAIVGATHRQGTSLLLVPPFIVAYLLPLYLTGRFTASTASSIAYAGPVCVLMAESFSWFTTQALCAQQALARSEERFRAIVQNTKDILLITTLDGTIVYHSPSAVRELGYAPLDLPAGTVLDLVHPEDHDATRQLVGSLREGPGRTHTAEFRCRRHDRTWAQFEAVGVNLSDLPGVDGLLLTARDITERKRMEEDIRYQAEHDPLTGLPNRATIRERLQRTLAAGHRTINDAPSVLFIDLDDFKTVNDTLGHDAGDAVLVAVAERLRHCVRGPDTVARLGGDEFAILVERGGLNAAVPLAQSILHTLDTPVTVATRPITIRTSVGIAVDDADPDGAESDRLFARADIAMYEAKRNGKGRYAVYHPAIGVAITGRPPSPVPPTPPPNLDGKAVA